MSINTFYNTTFSVSRYVANTGSDARTSSYVVQSSGNDGVTFPLDEEAQTYGDFNYSKDKKLYCDEDIDVKVSDKITIDGAEYSVKAVTKYIDLEDDTDSFSKIFISKSNAQD